MSSPKAKYANHTGKTATGAGAGQKRQRTMTGSMKKQPASVKKPAIKGQK